MKRELWGETELSHRLRVAGPSATLCRTIRDDLTRRLISTQRVAWRILRVNAELRERVHTLEAENITHKIIYMYSQNDIDILNAQLNGCRTACDHHRQRVAELERALAAASQAESEWIDIDSRQPEPGMYVQVTSYVKWRENSATDFGYHLDAPVIAWCPLEGESDERTD